jgi:hypothetical protein
MDTVLPLEDSEAQRRQPWLLHMLAVNTLNFCSFALCEELDPQDQSRAGSGSRGILIAVPSAMDSDDVSRRFHG